MIPLLVTEVVELELCVRCTDTLWSRAVSSCQPRFKLRPSTDVLKYKLVKAWHLVPFFVALHFLKYVLFCRAHTGNLQRKPRQCRAQIAERMTIK